MQRTFNIYNTDFVADRLENDELMLLLSPTQPFLEKNGCVGD